MFKFNISTNKGKTFKLEAEAPGLKQQKIGDIVKGEEISSDLSGYELQITGASDISGLPALESVEGIGLKRVLLGLGTAMHKRPKGTKKKPKRPTKGLRLRKTIRGNIISDAISQINMKVVKQGAKSLNEIFPEQNKSEAPPAEVQAEAVAESPKQAEQKSELAHPEKEPKEVIEKEQEQS